MYDNRDKRIASRYLDVAGSVVFSGYQFPLGSIRVSVVVYGNNNGTSRASRNLTVVTGTRPEAPNVTPPESLTVQPRTYYDFAINTENAEKAAVRYFRIGSPNDLNYSEFNVDSGETTSWREYQYNSGNRYFFCLSFM